MSFYLRYLLIIKKDKTTFVSIVSPQRKAVKILEYRDFRNLSLKLLTATLLHHFKLNGISPRLIHFARGFNFCNTVSPQRSIRLI